MQELKQEKKAAKPNAQDGYKGARESSVIMVLTENGKETKINLKRRTNETN